MRRIGFKHGVAWDAACQGTVSKNKRGYSLPFGFVQSPVLASFALTTSALGAGFVRLHNQNIKVSVYMDDFILSGDGVDELTAARDSLAAAAEVSGFRFTWFCCRAYKRRQDAGREGYGEAENRKSGGTSAREKAGTGHLEMAKKEVASKKLAEAEADKERVLADKRSAEARAEEQAEVA